MIQGIAGANRLHSVFVLRENVIVKQEAPNGWFLKGNIGVSAYKGGTKMDKKCRIEGDREDIIKGEITNRDGKY